MSTYQIKVDTDAAGIALDELVDELRVMADEWDNIADEIGKSIEATQALANSIGRELNRLEKMLEEYYVWNTQ